MAVTVTPTAPDKNTHKKWIGSYGVHGSDAYVSLPNATGTKERLTVLALAGTYLTNGFAITPANYGLVEIYGMALILDGKSGGGSVPFLSTTGANPIVKLVTDNVPTELANLTSVANHSYTVLLFGV